MAEVSNTDLRTAIKYLEDATKLYDALALLPMQTVPKNEGKAEKYRLCRVMPGLGRAKCNCRSHMIKQLIIKLKNKLPNDKK